MNGLDKQIEHAMHLLSTFSIVSKYFYKCIMIDDLIYLRRYLESDL